jgi:hypothetical protein
VNLMRCLDFLKKAQTTKEAFSGALWRHNVWCRKLRCCIKELIAAGKLKGTVRLWNPAEEDLAGKVYMARAGLFNDLDVCLIGTQIIKNMFNKP